LNSIDYNIDNFLAPLGATTWDKHIMLASEQICSILKGRQFIVDSGNVIRLDDVNLITAYKTLSIIYYNLGDDYREKRNDAERIVNDILSAGRFSFDKNSNGLQDTEEIQHREGRLTRT
jgi:hypothetical protein